MASNFNLNKEIKMKKWIFSGQKNYLWRSLGLLRGFVKSDGNSSHFECLLSGFVKSDGSSVVSSRVTEILCISNAIPWFRQGPDCLVRRKGSLNVQQAFTRTLTFRSSKIPLIFFDLFDLLEFLCEICKCKLLSTCGCPNYKHAALPLQSLFKFEVKWCHHWKLCDKNADIQEN